MRRNGPGGCARRALVLAMLAAVTLGGIATPAAAMTGGRTVVRGEAPWMAALVDRGGMRCGGVLIAPDRVLTAGHCTAGLVPRQLHVVLGDDRLPLRGKALPVRGIATHPRYRELRSPFVDPSAGPETDATSHDVGIVVLRRPVNVTPLAVETGAPAPGTGAVVYGRGARDALGATTRQLFAGAVAVLAASRCRGDYRQIFHADSMLCADTRPGSSLCGGDSGGPLVVRTPAGRRVIGVVAWGNEVKGKECGAGEDPDVFARVDAALPFLGASQPVLAPSPSRAPVVERGAERLTCRAGRWSGHPRLRYRWIASGGGRERTVLGRRPTLRLDGERLAGRRLTCIVQAANDGGRVERTTRGLRL